MKYRLDKQDLLDRISIWDTYLKRKVHIIACGGTAITLLGLKDSTKDIDLIVPEPAEYDYLIKILKDLGYKPTTGAGWTRGDGFIFDLFRGKRVHTTELIESPLKEGNHSLLKEWSYIYLGIINYYDLITSKIFRYSAIDIEDCLNLVEARRQEIDLQRLEAHFHKTASFDIAQERVMKNFEHFLRLVREEELTDEE
jgi:hypothetical protein